MKLEDIKGLGPKNIKLLNKLNILNMDDLINYYPYRFNIYERSDINSLNQDDKIVIDGIIETVPTIFRINRKLDKMSFKLNISTNLLNVTIFNRSFLKSKLNIGTSVTIVGKYNKRNNSVVANELRFGLLSSKVIDPVYHTTYGINSKQINSFINEALNNVYNVVDLVPKTLTEKYGFNDKLSDLKVINNPSNSYRLKMALNHLKYEELFLFMLKMNYLKQNNNIKIGLEKEVDYDLIKKFIDELPFKLTEDQLKAVDDIYKDMTNKKRMNRLLQGDVGSGKTIVAIISMYINYLAGYQSALMAPTEILAIQHYNNICQLFENKDIKIGLLTGKMKVKEKRELYKELEEGKIDFIIGTHALISDGVIYKNLGLVITDEQHRFGVAQRGNLKNKGLTPDILYMSATPIPRTYALTIYGDMDISSIKTLPSGKKEIITTLKSESEMKDILTSMYNELKNGHQIYVVSPLIEESDKSDLKNVYELEENMNKAFGKLYNIGVLHGKMSNSDKDKVMEDFKNNKINILISTTVIEVGVDVKNATMMVIFDSYRFGLSALHQLRGRVGRNNIQSYCILISNRETERLKILTKTNDGFKISEEDFKLRGSGDLFGNKQSGDMAFKIANLKSDFNILLKAKEDSMEYINNNYDKVANYLNKHMDLD